MEMDHKKNTYTGISSVISQLTGGLFLENIKMEKQRTNMSYKKIANLFMKKPMNYFTGFFPYGLIQSFGKGYIVSYTKLFIQPHLQYNNTINNLIIGMTTGVLEASFLSPMLFIRNQLNQNVTEKKNQKIKINYKLMYYGMNALIVKRSLDWSSRYIIIDKVNKLSPFSNKAINIFIGSGLSTIISMPADRLLPLIYSNQSIIKVMKKQSIIFFYKGFCLRFISTGYYTTCLFLLPNFISKYL